MNDSQPSPSPPGPLSRRAYLGIGSNLGDRVAYLQHAIDGLIDASGVEVAGVSPVYETDPVGGPEQPSYLNAVVAIEAELTVRELLELAQRLEADAHRVRGKRWGPRTLDIDVLWIDGEEVHEADLEVPHPRMWERGFVMAPLHDLAPDLASEMGRLPPPGGWPGARRCEIRLVLR